MPEWVFGWRYWLVGAAFFVLVYAVESVRKLGFVWPWPLVPLAIWAGLIAWTSRGVPGGRPPAGTRKIVGPRR